MSVDVGPKPVGFKEWWALFRVDMNTQRASLGSKNYDTRLGPIAAGQSAVWVGSTYRGEDFEGRMERFDATTGERTAKVVVDGRPLSIDATTNDVVAVIQTPGDLPNYVARIDVAHERVAARVTLHGSYVVAVRSGQAWVLDRKQASSVTTLIRLSLPDLTETGRRRIPLDYSSFGYDFAVSDSGVWVAGEFPPKLLWIDPVTLRILRTSEQDPTMQHIVAGLRSVWAVEASNGHGTLSRIDVVDVAAAR
jgi:hypothetical protein